MSRINLLPWREELKNIRNRLFFTIAGAAVFMGIVVVYMVHLAISYRIGVENANIDYLNKELLAIKKQISQIQGLQESKENLLSRMRIIQALQEDRSSIVKLLDIVPRVVPESIYLLSLTRTDNSAANMAGPDSVAPSPPPPVAEETTIEKMKKEVGLQDPEKKIAVAKKQYEVVMTGVAQTNSAISTLMKNLQAVYWVSDIKYSEVAINKSGEGLNFKLEFTQKIEDLKQELARSEEEKIKKTKNSPQTGQKE